MAKRRIPKPLTWLFFFISVGALVTSGIYVSKAVTGGSVWDILRAVVFGLLGIFAVIMYGEGRSNRGS